MIQTEFLISPPDQKGIGIQQKQQGKDGDDHHAKSQNGLHDAAALHLVQTGGEAQRVDDVVHADGTGAGSEVRKIQLPIFPDTGERQPGIQRGHLSSPPVWSRVRVSEIRW